MNEAYHNYTLPCPCNTDDIEKVFKVTGSRVKIRDESILGIPMGPMGMGIAKLISWEWELLDGNGRE